MNVFHSVLVVYICYCVVVYTAIRLAPFAGFLIERGIEYLAIACVWLARAIARGTVWFFQPPITWRLFAKARFLREREEQRRREEEERARRAREEAASRARARAERERRAWQQRSQSAALREYEQALAVLGLTEPVTSAAFTRAFRRAMMRAHPDRGGTKQRAQALNAARAVIREHHGW